MSGGLAPLRRSCVLAAALPSPQTLPGYVFSSESPSKRTENGGAVCGLGFELVFLTALALRLRGLKRLRA